MNFVEARVQIGEFAKEAGKLIVREAEVYPRNLPQAWKDFTSTGLEPGSRLSEQRFLWVYYLPTMLAAAAAVGFIAK